jgi:uncharacterized protein (DUF58 family)
LFVAFALWTFVLGVVLGSAVLVIATVPVAMYLVFVMLGSQPHLDVSLRRILPEGQTYEGERVAIRLTVKNDGPRIDLEIADEVPPGIDVAAGSSHVFAVLDRGESRDFAYTLLPRVFGTYTFGPIRLRASDRATSRYEAKTLQSFSFLRVYPEVRYLSRIELRHTRPRNWPGETPIRRAGQGTEFYGIREYIPGDSLRRVNWKAFARSGHLMLNQYMNEAGGETVVVLDFRSSSMVGTPPDTTLAYSVRAAAALSYRLLRDRNRVGLLGVGRRLNKVPPGFGRRQFERILVGLITTEASDDDWSIDLFPYYISLYYSRMVQVVLVSPLVDYRPIYLVLEMARKGYDVLVVSPSPVELEEPREGEPQTLKLAKELAVMDRNQRLASLRKHARVVDWNPRLPLEDAMEELRESWRVRRPV